MKWIINFLFLKGYKTLAAVAAVLLLLVIGYLIYGSTFLVNNLNDALNSKNDRPADVVPFDLTGLEKIKNKLPN